MARSAGINLPIHKHIEVALTAIYGIGRPRAQDICASAGVPVNTKVKDLTDAQVDKLRIEVGKFTVEGDLRRTVSMSIKRLMDRRFAALINDPAIISFAGGVPSPATLPSERIAHYAEKVIRDNAAISLQYGPTRGLPAMRDAVAAVCSERGFACDPATQLLMTTGWQQALYLVAMTLLDPGDVVLVELPTYIGGAGAFYARRAELVGVAQDDDGIVLSALEDAAKRLKAEGRKVKFLYTIPNFQNPSGRVLAAERRRAVLDIAKRYGFLVVEDDPYGELCFADGVDTTPIKTKTESTAYLTPTATSPAS